MHGCSRYLQAVVSALASNIVSDIVSEDSMGLGMIASGRMGTKKARRLMWAGHPCVVCDVHSEAVQSPAKEYA
jgi:hypothetical protein